MKKKENSKRISNAAAIGLLVFSVVVFVATLFLISILRDYNLWQISGNNYNSLLKTNAEQISRRYSIYAMDDYLGDFNMDILGKTNFRYGVIHSDHFAELDLSDLRNYEVQNFDEDFNPSNVSIYSCYRDENTYISYDMSLGGYATLVNKSNVHTEHTAPVSQFIYNYNNNILYAKVDGYLFPISDENTSIVRPLDMDSDFMKFPSGVSISESEETAGDSGAETADAETPSSYILIGAETKEDTTSSSAASETVTASSGSAEAKEGMASSVSGDTQEGAASSVSADVQEEAASSDEEASDLVNAAPLTPAAHYVDENTILIDLEDRSYLVYTNEASEYAQDTGNSVQISYANFQDEVIVMPDEHAYEWNNPYSFLYLPDFSCILTLSDVTIADFRTIYDYGIILSNEDIDGYSFNNTDMSITYYTPLERTGVSYYVVSYVPKTLDYSISDLYTQTYRVLGLVYHLRYLPVLLLLVSGLSILLLSLLLLLRCFRFLTRFYKENLPLVLKCILLLSGIVAAELVILFLLHKAGIFTVSRRLLVLFLLEKALVIPVIIHITMQINKLQRESTYLAEGDYTHSFDTDHMNYELKKIGNNLNQMRDGMQHALDDRMKSEHFKTELITNVSHDIKTPLTSIVSYVDLLRKEQLNTPHSEEYLEVLERQSIKLKKLLEDLIEAAKASTGNLKVHLEPCDLSVVLSQVAGEYEEKLSGREIALQVSIPENPVIIQADSRHLQRVFDNLMVNIDKHAMPGTRAYITLETDGQTANVILKNISQQPLNIRSEELMERFVQGDASRNTDGHGLGLSISQSLMELMGGHLQLDIDGDLFKITLSWNLSEDAKDAPEKSALQIP